MKFRVVPNDRNFDLLHLVSEGGKWELGFTSILYGVRVRLGRVGDCGVAADLCCGDESWLRMLVLGHVSGILFQMNEEDLTSRDIRTLFPHPRIKPLSLDPVWCEILNLQYDYDNRRS